ncbi:MAG: BNR-4 repeat-containing protein [Gemmatimonadota bacterium]|nr:BNR-4 repeat-containing protein [Gemmatimonadota bacterium]
MDATTQWGIGGAGGAYFLAEPGELVIDVQKRDRNVHNRRTDLRALLVTPDRMVLQEATLPDTGPGDGEGPLQHTRLSTHVNHKGIYKLNITVSNDRYGEEIVWAFRTNCRHYLIETSRGHKDARHEEPIVLLAPEYPGDVCFLPPEGAFAVEIEDLPDAVRALTVFDATGSPVDTLAVRDGRVAHTFPADLHRATPWRLHLPAQQAVIHIDGVTRWTDGDPHVNMSYWTPHLESFFPLHGCRWLLTPWNRTLYVDPGASGTIDFQVRNSSSRPQTVRLTPEIDGAAALPGLLSRDAVDLGALESTRVTARYNVPDSAGGNDVLTFRLRATSESFPEISTYSTLTLRTGTSPVRRPLRLPLVLKPYEHENAQFGFVPDCPVENQIYFDLDNRPFARTERGISALRDGIWTESDFRRSVLGVDNAVFGTASTKIAFDAENLLYIVANVNGQPNLLCSADQGCTFSACAIPGREDCPRTFDIEWFTGHNSCDGPPPVLRYARTAEDARLFWRKVNDLEVFLPEKTSRGLSLGEPILVSDQCIGLSQHSGIPASVVSREGKVHVIWAEATDPDEGVPGVPTYVATIDRTTRQMGSPALVGYGPPANDVHNSPSITMDSRGFLHALSGTHGCPFPYSRSLAPDTAGAGWTEPGEAWPDARQTYIGFVCDPEDTLHSSFRLWWNGTGYFPAGNYATLAHQQCVAGGVWQEPRVLVVPPFSEYSVFYHRLTIDRTGRLFLSYDYFSTYWFYRNDHPGSRRSLMMSPDRGDTWKLVETSDLVGS